VLNCLPSHLVVVLLTSGILLFPCWLFHLTLLLDLLILLVVFCMPPLGITPSLHLLLIVHVNNITLDQKRPVENLCVDVYHLFLILLFLSSLLSFEILYSLLHDRPRFDNVSILAVSQHRTNIRCEFLLTHFTNRTSFFLLLYFSELLLLLLFSQIYQCFIFHCYRNIYLCFYRFSCQSGQF